MLAEKLEGIGHLGGNAVVDAAGNGHPAELGQALHVFCHIGAIAADIPLGRLEIAAEMNADPKIYLALVGHLLDQRRDPLLRRHRRPYGAHRRDEDGGNALAGHSHHAPAGARDLPLEHGAKLFGHLDGCRRPTPLGGAIIDRAGGKNYRYLFCLFQCNRA